MNASSDQRRSTMNKYKTFFLSVAFIAFVLSLISNYATSSVVNIEDQINMILLSCDNSIGGIKINAQMTMTYEKGFFNSTQISRKKRTDDRDYARDDITTKDTNELIISETDVDQIRNLEIIFSGGKTQITHVVQPNIEENKEWSYIDFIEPGKFYSISNRNRKTDQQMVNIEDRLGAPDSFNTMTAHSFGRGLSFFLENRKTLEIDESNPNLYILKVYIENQVEPFGIFILDKSKSFCWTSAQFLANGTIEAKSEASDFKEIDGVWIPFTITSFSYLDGFDKWAWKNKVIIQEVTFLDESQKVLDVFDLIPANTKIFKNN